MSKMAEKQEALREESIQSEEGKSTYNEEGANRSEEVGKVEESSTVTLLPCGPRWTFYIKFPFVTRFSSIIQGWPW